MSFDSTAGTRGRRQPGRWARRFNKLTSGPVRKKGKVMGMNALVLTTIGRKSGVQRQSPLGWFPGEGDSWLVVAAGAGSIDNPAWYYNLAAHPDQAWVETAGRKVAVAAEQLHGPAREEAWHHITTAAKNFLKYQKATDRELPIIRLTPKKEQED